MNEDFAERKLVVAAPPAPTKRYIHYTYLAPIQVHTICQSCHAPCCRLPYIHTAITMAEGARVYCPKHKRRWTLQIFYPASAHRWRSLRSKAIDEPLRRFVTVRGIRMDVGGPVDGYVEVYIAKKDDGSCVHQRKDGRCAIYAQRPHACKAWFCGRGTSNDRTWRDLCEQEREAWKPKQEAGHENPPRILALRTAP